MALVFAKPMHVESPPTLERHMDRRKEILLATLAHDLRNPLTATHRVVQRIGGRDGSPPDKQNVVAVLADQIRHPVHSIDDLLETSRITGGKITVRRADIDLAAAVRHAVAEVSMLSPRYMLGIGLALLKNLVKLYGGRVEAHSDGPGHGSEFVVRLPCV